MKDGHFTDSPSYKRDMHVTTEDMGDIGNQPTISESSIDSFCCSDESETEDDKQNFFNNLFCEQFFES